MAQRAKKVKDRVILVKSTHYLCVKYGFPDTGYIKTSQANFYWSLYTSLAFA